MNNEKLMYSVESLSDSAEVGRTNIHEAIRAGELKTVNPVIKGKRIKRTLIPPEEAQRWVSTFIDREAC